MRQRTVAIVSVGMALGLAASTRGQAGSVPEPQLREDAVDAIIADLEAHIPGRMQQDGVLGLSIALIRDGEVAWTRGFGVANSITREPVTAETVFSVASNGKPVAAYAALRLVDQGRLGLDEPLLGCFTTPWLPRSAGHDAITLRHVLAHTSGLSNVLGERSHRQAFEPGERFRYSGVGFMYMQAALAAKTGESLDDLARRLVFEPLGMTQSCFGTRAGPTGAAAAGHIAFGRALAPFAIGFTPLLAVLLAAALPIARWRLGRWRITRGACIACAALAALGAVIFLLWMGGGAVMTTYFALAFAALVAAWGALARGGAALLAMALGPGRARLRRWLLVPLWSALCLAALVGLTRSWRAPLPDWFHAEGNAASSLRSTAPDLARFMIELSDPRHLDGDLATRMGTPQVTVNEHVSWGLGIGIQHGRDGDSLWQWGSNPGSRSIMVVYPQRRLGVVVLTNGANASDLVAEVAQRAVGGKAFWSISQP